MRASKQLELEKDGEGCHLSIALQNRLKLTEFTTWGEFTECLTTPDRLRLNAALSSVETGESPSDSPGQEAWCLLHLPVESRTVDEGGEFEPYAARLESLAQGRIRLKFLDSDELRSCVPKANDEGEDLNRQLAVVAHDLREPLRTISRFVDAIQSTDNESDQAVFFDAISDASIRMRRLLDGILEFSATTSVTSLQPVDLMSVLQEVQSNLHDQISRTNAQISYAALPTIPGQYTLFVQLFQNLIANAVKFRQEDTTPTVQIDSESSPQRHIIHVRDNGRGIEPSLVPKAFDAFHAVGAERGAGLGLSICKRVVDALGGTIELESQLERGTTVHIKFPRPQ